MEFESGLLVQNRSTSNPDQVSKRTNVGRFTNENRNHNRSSGYNRLGPSHYVQKIILCDRLCNRICEAEWNRIENSKTPPLCRQPCKGWVCKLYSCITRIIRLNYWWIFKFQNIKNPVRILIILLGLWEMRFLPVLSITCILNSSLTFFSSFLLDLLIRHISRYSW